MNPNGTVDELKEGLDNNQIIIGWSRAIGLLEEDDWPKFREIVKKAHYSDHDNYRAAGAAGGHLWRFIKEMRVSDLVVVPVEGGFYVAKIREEKAIYLGEKIEDGTSYRRGVEWLNNKKPIPRINAVSALVSRMKARGTCTEATDLLKGIEQCLSGKKDNLKNDLIQATLEQLKRGHIDPDRFEEFLRALLEKFGGKGARVIKKANDKGVDVLAEFPLVWGLFPRKLAVQAKHFLPYPPVNKEVVDKLVSGMEFEGADVGMIITTGTFSEDVEKAAQQYYEKDGKEIALIDGELLAEIIVDGGFPDNVPFL
jgi:predicted Mrr-cat superfamily restriction endonuclease